MSRIAEFTDALRRVAAGGTAMAPDVIAQLRAIRGDPVAPPAPSSEREVLALMAERHDNATIARRLCTTDNAVHKHIGSVFLKLGLSADNSGHCRIRTVLAYLRHHNGTEPTTC
ncbi:response regulator transcription factor [Streptomyces albus]|uniref:response regulator transcription factor n=1 Tax=Streptomyces albus TaxID=1888 RepID=UPI001A9BBFCD|nr:response regulator transcription factor [Streptomyces albus]